MGFRRRGVDLECDLHEKHLIARELSENGAAVIIDLDAVGSEEIKVQEFRREVALGGQRPLQ
jgi:hypothetical protein